MSRIVTVILIYHRHKPIDHIIVTAYYQISATAVEAYGKRIHERIYACRKRNIRC
jgi:hypothetical protein